MSNYKCKSCHCKCHCDGNLHTHHHHKPPTFMAVESSMFCTKTLCPSTVRPWDMQIHHSVNGGMNAPFLALRRELKFTWYCFDRYLFYIKLI